jgi:copper transport protein
VRGSGGRRWALRLACCLTAGAWVLLVPVAAQAHAVLVSSVPAAGATVGVTPGAVVLTFDEPLASRLSHADVVDPTGRRFEDAVSGETMRVPLSTNAPGVYRVSWKTVSEFDGHTRTGTFEFGVGVSVAAAGSGSPGPTSDDVLVAAFRLIEYAFLLLACGLAVLRRLGRGLAMRLPAISVSAGLLASGVAVVLGEGALAASGISWAGLVDYLTLGVTGWARVVRLGLEAGLLAVACAHRRLSLWLLTGVVGAISVAGHAADVEPAWLGMALNAGHLAAAAVWAGGILALAYVRVAGGWPTVGRALLARFSRVAPWAFLVSVALGGVQAALLLGSPGDVLSTGYGRALLVKAVLIAGMVPLSLLAWRRLRVTVRGEAALALLVVAVAALLSAFPSVPREAEEAAEGSPAVAHTGAAWAPQPGDVTMGGRAGDTLVGLSVDPGRPGRNHVVAYLAPPPAAGSNVRLSVDGRWSAFTACGRSCRTATVDLRGAADLKVAIAGHGTAAFALPALPARDGTALAERAARWMDGLRSYRVREVLSGIRSAYAYTRPHAVWVRIWYGGVAHDTVWRGRDIYERDAPDSSWKLQSRGVLPPVPYFVWNPFKPFVDAQVIGTATVADVPVTLVSLFGGHGRDPESVWFTLWIDPATGQVLRSQMWAPTHFMDDVYYAFDQPADIPTP